MAGSPTESSDTKKEPIVVCSIDFKGIVVALHETALEKAQALGKEYTVQNSAIDGEGKDAKFYGAGSHIIAAIPKENKGLDKNKIPRKTAFAMLQEYIQWFVGPDLKAKLTEADLIPLPEEDSGKVEDTHKKKEDIEKSRGSAEGSEKVSTASKEKYKESIDRDFPTFSQYLLLEETPGDSDSSGPQDQEANNSAAASSLEASGSSSESNDESSSGYYVAYQLDIKPGDKGHPIADAFKKLGTDLLKGFGISVGSWRSGSSGDVHTLGDLANSLADVFGKIDPKELETKVSENMSKKFKDGDFQVKIIDTKTIVSHLNKQLSGSDKQKIKSADMAVCTKVNKKDKSYKLYNKRGIADCITMSVSGIFKKVKNAVSEKDVILVNNYSENKKRKEDTKYTEKGEGAVEDSLNSSYSGSLLTEAVAVKADDAAKKLKELAEDLPEEWQAATDVKETQKILTDLQNAGIDEARWFEDLKTKGRNAFLIKIKSQLKGESANADGHLLNLLFEKELDSKDDALPKIKNVFDKLLIAFKDRLPAGTELKTDEIDHLVGHIADKEANESTFKTYSFMKALYEDYSLNEARLLLEGHCPEWTELMQEIKEIGADAFNIRGKKDKKTKKRGPDAAEKLRAAYEKHLADAKKDKKYADSEYTQKIDTSSKNWINKTLISSLHADPDNPMTKERLISKFEEAFKGKNRDTSDERPEIYALLQAVKDLKKDLPKPEPEKPQPEPEQTETQPQPDPEPVPMPPEIEEFEYKFFDYDPKNPDDEDPAELKTGSVKKGGSISPPASPKHEGFEFIGWKPDDFDNIEKPMTYVSQYAEAKPHVFPVVFYDWKFDGDTPVEVAEIDTQYIEQGKSASAPADPDHTKHGWKFIGWDTEFSNVTAPLNVMAEYQNLIKIAPKAPEDPSKPEDSLQPVGDPFEFDPAKKLKDQLPELPEKDGWQPDGWQPDPDEFDPNKIEDPKEPAEFIGKYKKIIKIITRLPKKGTTDPLDDDSFEDQEPVDYDPSKPLKDQLPEHPSIDGFEPAGWDPDPESVSDPTDDIYITAKYVKKDNSQWVYYVIADENGFLEDKGVTFEIKLIDTDPEDPDNTKSQKEIAVIQVVDSLYKVEDLKAKAKTAVKDEADKLIKAAEANDKAFKEVDNIKPMEDAKKPYKFLGWTTDKNESGKPSFDKVEIEEVIQQVISDGVDSDEEVILKTVWSNDIKAVHTELDFYIVPLKGLGAKKRYNNQTGRTEEQ